MILGFGRKKLQPTFKQRVATFWNWFPTAAPKLYQAIEKGDTEYLTREVTDFMNEHLPNFAWVFGPGENGGHSFTMSGEGIVAKQLLTEFWHSQSHQLPGWTFYASRQASPRKSLEGFAIAFAHGESLDLPSFQVKTHVDQEHRKIDILAWHPMFAKVPEEHRLSILYLLLDETLGEFGTETWLGEIQCGPLSDDKHVVSLIDLPAKIHQVQEYFQWENVSPLRAYTVYSVDTPSRSPRGDTLFGSTCIPGIINDFITHRGRLKDNPLEGTGAEWVYLQLDGSLFPDGEQVEVRSNIEEAIDEALMQENLGRALGGAFGKNYSYVEFIIFDGENSRNCLLEKVRQLQLGDRAQLKSIA